MLGVIPVGPGGTDRRFSPAGSEMALGAVRGQVVAGGAVQSAPAVKCGAFRVQPCLGQRMIGNDLMAVMTIRWQIPVRPVDVMTFIANPLKPFESFMFIIIPVGPVRPSRNLAPGSPEMALGAIGRQIVARGASQIALSMKLRAFRVYPCLPQRMFEAVPVAIMAIRWRIPIQPVYIMTFIANVLIKGKSLMCVVISVIPVRIRRHLTPGRPEMALRTIGR